MQLEKTTQTPPEPGKLNLGIEYVPLAKQRAFHRSASKFKLYIGAWRAGKCLYKDQKVLCSSGEHKKSKDLKVGDRIFGYDPSSGKSTICKITATETHLKPTERYLLSDNTEITCSVDHRFPCSWQGYDKVKKIGDIARKTKGNIAKGQYYLLGSQSIEFAKAKKSFKISPYILGLLLGDGGMTQNFVTFSTASEELLDELSRLEGITIKKGHGEYDYRLVSHERDQRGYNVNWVVTELRRLDLIGKNSHTKFIPKEYLLSSEKNRKEILSGLVDTDGTVGKRGAIEFCTCSEQLANDVIFILRTIGIRAKANKHITYSQDKKKCLSYRITWKDNKSVNLRVPFKRNRLRKRSVQRSHRVYIKEFFDFGIQECIDISIDHPSHLFLLDNLIATHNTFAGCVEAYSCCLAYPGCTGVIFRKDFSDLQDTTIKTLLEEVIPHDFVKEHHKTEHRITLKNGSIILYRHLKNGKKLGSLNLSWFFIDEAEEVEESMFEYLKGRLSSNLSKERYGWLVSNPPNEDHWIYRVFELENNYGHETFHASTYENREHLPEDYIESLEHLPPSWRKKYLEGQYGFTPDGKPYYEGYLEAVHKRKCTFNPQLPVDCGWDFGYHHVAFCVTQCDGTHWKILKELMGTDITIQRFASVQVIPFLNEHFPNANLRHFGDPAVHQVNDKSEQTSHEILQELGIYVHTKVSTYRERKEIIDGKINMLQNGLPLLIVDPSCRVINDGFLGGYHFPVRKDGQQATHKFDVPYRDGFYEHLMNSMEYVAVNKFSPLTNKGSRQRRQRPKSMDNM